MHAPRHALDARLRDPSVLPDPRKRLTELDTLRGIAILGIFIVHVQLFGLPSASNGDPFPGGVTSRADFTVWLVTHVLGERKLLPLFTVLFGAGILLQARRAEARGEAPGGIYARRMFWLMLIGITHAYLFFAGDILFHYGVCGLLVFLFRNKSPRFQLTAGCAALAVGLAVSVALGVYLERAKDAAVGAHLSMSGGAPLSDRERLALDEWKDLQPLVASDPRHLDEELRIYRGDYSTIFSYRAPRALAAQTWTTVLNALWRVGGLMLIGMALMKLGVLSGGRSTRFYVASVAAGYGLGLPLAASNALHYVGHGFDTIHFLKADVHADLLATLLVALGHLGAVMLLCRSGALGRLRRRLSAVGRMALSVYLSQSIIATTIFYGYGLGYFGHLGRPALLMIVPVVTAFHLYVCMAWLDRYQSGPAEWAWRTLAGGKRQPLFRQVRRREWSL